MTHQLFLCFHSVCTVPVQPGSDLQLKLVLVHSSSSWFCLLRAERLGDRLGTDWPISTAGPNMHADMKTCRLVIPKQVGTVGRKQASLGRNGKLDGTNGQLSSQFRIMVAASKKSLTLLWINTYIAVLNSKHSWMLPHIVQR